MNRVTDTRKLHPKSIGEITSDKLRYCTRDILNDIARMLDINYHLYPRKEGLIIAIINKRDGVES